MGHNHGNYLERSTARILERAGWEVKVRAKIGVEVDVLATKYDLTIGVQCKHYESGYLNVQDMIYEWEGKAKDYNFDKMVFVVVGFDIKQKYKDLIKSKGMILWEEEKLHFLNDLSIEDLETKLEQEFEIEFEEEEEEEEEEEKFDISGILKIDAYSHRRKNFLSQILNPKRNSIPNPMKQYELTGKETEIERWNKNKGLTELEDNRHWLSSLEFY